MGKELYATAENIEKLAEKWISAIPTKRRWKSKIRKEDSALLVIDMQNYFLQKESPAYLPSAEAIIKNINRLVDLFSESIVIFTTHIHRKGDEGIMREWWNDLPTKGEFSEIDSRINVSGIVLEKSRYSAYHHTTLEKLLRKNGIKNVFITGVMTDICCMATAIDSFVKDFRVFFLADATATTREIYHLSTLISLSHGIAEVILCREVPQRLL